MGQVWITCDLIKRIFVVREGCVVKMPSDIVSFAVSTGLGVSVLAGIVSGVCYIFTHGVQRKSDRKPNREWYCDVCGVYLRSVDHILEGNETVTCTKCKGKVCQTKCSSLNKQRTGWTCKNCLRPPETWFQGILNAIQPITIRKVQTSTKMQADPLNEIDEDLEALQKKGKEQVQDFLEKLVNAMLGQNVDDASVTKTYNDELYLPLSGQSPCTAHAALKQLIEKILREVVNLPSLQKLQENSSLHPDLNNKTYEDLLATAILNKVISSSQNTLPSSSAASVSSRPTSSLEKRDEKEYFFGDETLDSKWKTTDLETTSISSLEEWIQSDSSFGSRKYVDRFTLTIKQDIEELSQTDSENEDDDREYFCSKSLLSDDEPNWYLQKRQFQGTASPVPVPMLVPSPTTEAKVLIGDKEVDETSDLSDAGSDYGENEPAIGRQSLILESKTIIGGKNLIQNGAGGSESESSADSGVKEVDRDRFEYDEVDFVRRTDITVDDDNVEDASLLSMYSNTEKEAEYTEKYASLPRTIFKTSTTPTPSARPSLQRSSEELTDNKDIVQTNNNDPPHEEISDEEISDKEFSSNYSKREKEKWKNAIEMKNNPYSKENIENRIKRSNSTVSSLFGPDYYAKLASSPSGMKKKLQEMRVPGFPGYDEDIIGDILKENQFPGKIDAPWPPPRSKNEVQDKDIYSAVPVIIYDEVDYKTGPTESPSMTGDYTTSDSDMSFINYYDVEKSQVYKTQKEKSDVNGNIPGEKDKHRETTNSNLENKSVETPTPKPRERPNYVKQQTKTPNTLTNKIEPRELKRAQSESDLLSDSFYTPPRVLTKKKDNTLISKIYSNPHVRSFALSNRNSIPAETGMPTPNFRTQLSVPENILQARYNDKNSLYNSDEGAPMKKQTLYSSAEDLIEANKPGQYQRARSPKFSISSEDDLLSEQSLEHGKLSKSHMFSSYEDLVSAEEYEQIPRKKDNTLISRIYQQQNVRNYALSNRDFIPDNGKSVRKYSESVSSEDILSDDGSRVKEINKQPAALQRKADTEKRIVIEKENVPISSEEIECETNVVTPDQEINEVARKKIVHNILDQIGNPQQKHKVSRKQVEEYQESNNTDEEITVSVKELRRKFEKEQGTSKVVSSLTARSISKQMKETLKN